MKQGHLPPSDSLMLIPLSSRMMEPTRYSTFSKYCLVLLLLLFTNLLVADPALAENEFSEQFVKTYSHSKYTRFFTTVSDGATRRTKHFSSREQVYVHALPTRHRRSKGGLKNGDYVYQVTEPGGHVLLSPDPAECRIVRVTNGVITALRKPTSNWALVDRAGNDACNTQDNPDGLPGVSEHHDTNTDGLGSAPAIAVQLMPYAVTPNRGGNYRLWMIPWHQYKRAGGDPFSVPQLLCGARSHQVHCKPKQPLIGYAPDRGFGGHGKANSIIFKVRGTKNRAPIANAGPDQTTTLGATVTVDGSASTDADGDALSYAWILISKPEGSSTELVNPNTVQPRFFVDVPGEYTAQLMVNDGKVDSAADTVRVSTGNSPPVAAAGADQTLPVGAVASLDGSASTDADGDTLSFFWAFDSLPAGSSAALSDSAAIMPEFVIDLAGNYVVKLTVNDGMVDSPVDLVVVSTSNTPPVANAGTDQGVPVATTVTLDAAGSSDVDGDSLTYAWSLSKPAGSIAELSDPSTVSPSFVTDVPGTYVAQLIVNDGLVDSEPDTVQISTSNGPPVADAGANQTVVTGATVTLDGSASNDPDGDALSFSWAFSSRPAGSTAVLTNADTAMPGFIADLAGVYVVQLIVNDGNVDSAPATVTISTTNTPPVADAGAAQEISIPFIVMLDGSGSSDADGDPLTWRWSTLMVPDGSSATLPDPESVMPEFIADIPGDYIFQLIVNDGVADSDPDTVTVNLSPSNSPPVADAGPDQVIDGGSTVTLDGSASFDPEGDALSFSWLLATKPMGSNAELSDNSATMPTFLADRPGSYIARLIVTDGINSSMEDEVVVQTGFCKIDAECLSGRCGEGGWCTTSLGGRIFFDADGNGVFNTGDTGQVAGVHVQVNVAVGWIDLSFDVTDSSGFYLFTALNPAFDYRIRLVAPPGQTFTYTTPNVGTDDTIDSDVDAAGISGIGATGIDIIDQTVWGGVISIEGGG